MMNRQVENTVTSLLFAGRALLPVLQTTGVESRERVPKRRVGASPREDRIQKLFWVCVVCGLLATAFPVAAVAQFNAPQRMNFEVRIDQGLFNDVQVADVDVDLADDTELDSGAVAVLKTDPDLEAILDKAVRFAADGNYRVAVELWQAVLERSGDALYSQDNLVYRSLADQVERTLASLPAEGLRVYRVRADADARALLAAAGDPNDPVALNQVVRNYFPSSVGDDAAFRLGCLFLDQYDFVGALRLFGKIVERYPDTDLPLDQIQLRIALCHAYLGRQDQAEVAIDRARKILDDRSANNSKQLEQLEGSLGQLKIENVLAATDQAVKMYLSDTRRHGVMPSLSNEYLSGDLEAKWQFWFEPQSKYSRSDTQGRFLAGSAASKASVLDTRNGVERDLIEAWSEKHWRPAGQLLLQDGQLFFKSAADITAWNVEQVSAVSSDVAESKTSKSDTAKSGTASGASAGVAWRSLWRNMFEVDAATKMMELMRRNYGAYNLRGQNARTRSSPLPNNEAEIQLFGDLIYQQMSVCDDVLYAVEGQRFDEKLRSTGGKVRAQYNTSIRRTRKNWLTAYDVKSGRLLWSLPKKDTDQGASPDQPLAGAKLRAGNQPLVAATQWIDGGGFMAAPIAWQGLIVVPVNSGGAISIYGLDPQDGHTVWKSFLCDEPETGATAWSPIHLSIDGSDLFVGTGLGAVFVLDPSNGQVRFARRYPRSGTPMSGMRHYNGMPRRLNFDGWASDVIIPWQNQMVCFCSDTDTIFSLDRNTGRTIWISEMNPIGNQVDYLLGVVDGMLYAAGKDTVIAYDLDGEGRMVWGAEALFDEKLSRGRGMLTNDAIYMPVEDGIYKFSLTGKNGKAEVLSRVGVNLGTDAPVGNLFSDGKQIWVHGANRLYRLGPNDERDEG